MRQYWTKLLSVMCVCVVLFTACGGGGGGGDETPEPTLQSTLAPTPTPHVPTPTAEPATPLASPDSNPYSTPISSTDASTCDDGCLVRIETTAATSLPRPSTRWGTWSWIMIDVEDYRRLRTNNTPAWVVSDSTTTVDLYALRQREAGALRSEIMTFGDVLDVVDTMAIVRVSSVPPLATDVTNAGIWIEKVAPAPADPASVQSIGYLGPLADLEVGALMGDVDPALLEATILELQGSSSTDGTGVGTRRYNQRGNVMAAEWLYLQLEALGMRVWYEDFLSPGGHLVSNVIGEIPGSDESAVYGLMAHFDSIAYSDDTAPGADDNGSGVAATLEIARILSAYSLTHPLRIAFVNAEETQIVGSMAYAESLIQNNVPIEGVFNLDTIGNATFGKRIICNSGPQSAWMCEMLVRVNDGYGLGQDIWVRQNELIVADDNMLRNQGIESVLIARLMADEYDVHHSPDDTRPNMSLPNVTDVTLLLLLSTAALVQ